jgi:hypothetical protein
LEAVLITRRIFCAATVTAAVGVPFVTPVFAAGVGPITDKAQRLLKFYDGLGVEHKWLAGAHVNWETGEPDGGPVSAIGKHTHCSAFVGSVSKQLGIYILRPPEHGQLLLANAQLDWLEKSGAAQGWESLPDAVAAQVAANKGMFVVASYRNHDSKKPGHIAIIRPSLKPVDQLTTEGPDEIQAGLTNHSDTTLEKGFAGHPLAWERGKEVRFYAHDWDGTITPIA